MHWSQALAAFRRKLMMANAIRAHRLICLWRDRGWLLSGEARLYLDEITEFIGYETRRFRTKYE